MDHRKQGLPKELLPVQLKTAHYNHQAGWFQQKLLYISAIYLFMSNFLGTTLPLWQKHCYSSTAPLPQV